MTYRKSAPMITEKRFRVNVRLAGVGYGVYTTRQNAEITRKVEADRLLAAAQMDRRLAIV